MSQENVEIVRRVFDAGARRDAEAVFALYDPEVAWDTTRIGGGLVGSAVSHGHEGVQRWHREYFEAWETIDNTPDELIEAGEQVVSVMVQRGRGRASGVEVAQPLAAVWTIRDGRIVKVVWFPTREEALEAAGLSE